MSWFWGSGSKQKYLPPATNLQNQKMKQVESLRKLNPGAIEIIRDVEYRVTVQTGLNNITIIIKLPPQFPQDAPVLSVESPVSHPWVDCNMKIVGCPNVNNFSMHSNLGQAVQAVVEEFKSNPPQAVANYFAQFYPPVTTSNSTTDFPPYQPPQAAFPMPPLPNLSTCTEGPVGAAGSCQPTEDQSFPKIKIPDVFTAFPALKDMSKNDLLQLIENEDNILKLIQQLPEITEISQHRDSISTKCIELAKENLDKKPIIEELKKTIIIKLEEFERLKCEFERDCERHMSYSDQFHPSIIQTNLKVAVLEAEEESDKLADDFLENKIDVDEFKKKFMEQRILCHTRRAKEEKLNQIVMISGPRF